VLDTSARLLRVLSLLQSRPSWGGADLAERLGVTGRTVRRDVERLRSLGYPVAAAPGAGGGYRLGAGAALPPLLLDDDEAVAVVIGLRTSADGSVVGSAEASVRALVKLEQVLPARLRGRVAALQAATVPLPAAAATVDPDHLVVLAAACRTPERVRFGYRDRRGVVSQRNVEPLRLVHTGRRWYLVARDVERADWRTFRVDRVDRPVATGWRFAVVDPPDPVTFVATAIGTAPYRHHARVRLHAPAAVIAEQVPPTVGAVEALGTSTCELLTGSDSLDALALHLAILGVDFEVVEPPELVDRIGVLAARLARAAQSATPPPG
jgi:predicted DNA-binding transcriptional regulator YafY